MTDSVKLSERDLHTIVKALTYTLDNLGLEDDADATRLLIRLVAENDHLDLSGTMEHVRKQSEGVTPSHSFTIPRPIKVIPTIPIGR